MNLFVVLGTLLPVALVILLGFIARRTGLITDAHSQGVERVTYVVLFPVLLFSSLSTASFADADTLVLAALLAATQLVAGIAVWAAAVRTSLTGPKVTSVFQGACRFNSYVIFGLVFAIGGTTAIQTVAVPIALMIIIVNVFSVSILIRHGDSGAGPAPSIWRSLATNPLILACAAGLLANPLPIVWPAPVETVFDWFGGAAVTLGLFAVGAGLKPISARADMVTVLGTSTVKLIAIPAFFVGLALIFGLPLELTLLGLMAAAAPAATSSYILARQLGGDAPLMAQIVTATTLLSILTLTFWALVLPVLF